MNIKLVYRESNFNLDIMEDSPCQYLYRVAQKVFRKKENDIILFYGKIRIENDSRLLFDVMGKEDKEDILDEEIVTVKLKKEIFNDTDREGKYHLKSLRRKSLRNNSNDSRKLPAIMKSAFSPEKKKDKKLPIKCQICSHKNSIFYCRECNIFVCFECNIRYTEHHRHKRINLEDGDTKLGVQTYKEKILGELKLIDQGYKKFSKWIISNVDRDNFLQSTFKLLEKIKKNSQRLSDINTLYNLDQEMINNLKFDIEQTKIPFAQEELIDIFSSLNSKDKEIENYIKCVDLQIIKTEYNKVLVNCISNAQKHLKQIIDDVENKLRECDDMKFWGITEVKLYLKDHKMEKINFDIFNNEENQKIENKNNNNNGFTNSSNDSSDNDEKELKQFKMNLNVNSEIMDNYDNKNITERKKNDNINNNLDNNTNRRKSLIKLVKGGDPLSARKNQKSQNKSKKKSVVDYDDIKDGKNRNEDNDLGYINTINTKSRNNQYSNVKISKTLKDEDYNLDKNNDNDEGGISKKKVNNKIIQNLLSSYTGDNNKKFFSQNKNNSGTEFPLLLTNRNQYNNNDKHIQQNYKKYKDSTKYGKKLNFALKQKTSKKD